MEVDIVREMLEEINKKISELQGYIQDDCKIMLSEVKYNVEKTFSIQSGTSVSEKVRTDPRLYVEKKNHIF